jgi:tRNA(Ile)-lysidine synthetase-like protein
MISRKYTHSNTDLQDFYGILYPTNKTPLVRLITNIGSIWKENKDMWFSGEEMITLPTIYTVYSDCKGFNFALILNYDQINRHPYIRANELHKQIGFRFATHLALKILQTEQFSEMDEVEKVFTLLTLRHNKNHSMKQLVLTKLKHLTEENPTSSLYARFYKASIMDMFEYKRDVIGFNPLDDSPEGTQFADFEHIIEEPSHKRLELDNTLVYVKKCINTIPTKVSELIKEIGTFAISISGGGDSMLMSYYMAAYARKHNLKMILLHIAYNNRETCDDEIEFLRYYASRIIRCELYVYRIDEIKRQRATKMRSMYEEVTRRIRFGFYKAFDIPVFLGHNKDDMMENVFSNLAKQIHFENLHGMKTISNESGVTIVRPMLEYSKADITKWADSIGIPYLEDSTPAWSQRGKMRDVLVPQIHSFNPNIITGLHAFIEHTKILEQNYKILMDSFMKEYVTVSEDKDDSIATIDTTSEFFKLNHKSVQFWIDLWFKLDLDTRPSNKSIKNVIAILGKWKNTIKCNLNTKYSMKIKENTIDIIRQC